ncbi:MAG: uroporphyrinogen-III C-methyltransferase, partial [Elusimicrobia bacterium]|nr:uroporphyrinogen-III C-methyltransferase [Elusimicrobiota bacterium]
TVVRLKGGDPMIFGRGGEELEHLRAKKIDVEVVPGVSAANAAAAACRIPLTMRGVSRSVTIRTAHGASQAEPRAEEQSPIQGADCPRSSAKREEEGTLVYYMVASRLAELSGTLITQGLDPKTPAVLIRNISRPDEKTVRTTLKGMARLRLASPVTLILGEVAKRSLEAVLRI